MEKEILNVAVMGAGSWGTTLAMLLARNAHRVRLWSYSREDADNIRKTRINTRFLPAVHLPESIQVVDQISEAMMDAEFVVMATPAQHARAVVRAITECQPTPCPIVNVSKGIEIRSLSRISEVLASELPPPFHPLLATLSGPSHAEEVSKSMPTVVVAASGDLQIARRVQNAFMQESFRVYTSKDVAGVELAGALKNVVAVAAGICDGLGFGDNTKGALMTRGLAEITRLGVVLGANPHTFAGLAGMGDLITTCCSHHSRNRFVGERIGRGETLEKIMHDMIMVAEGVPTTNAAVSLAALHGVEMPISQQVHQVLFDGKNPTHAVRELMMRPPRPEVDWEAEP